MSLSATWSADDKLDLVDTYQYAANPGVVGLPSWIDFEAMTVTVPQVVFGVDYSHSGSDATVDVRTLTDEGTLYQVLTDGVVTLTGAQVEAAYNAGVTGSTLAVGTVSLSSAGRQSSITGTAVQFRSTFSAVIKDSEGNYCTPINHAVETQALAAPEILATDYVAVGSWTSSVTSDFATIDTDASRVVIGLYGNYNVSVSVDGIEWYDASDNLLETHDVGSALGSGSTTVRAIEQIPPSGAAKMKIQLSTGSGATQHWNMFAISVGGTNNIVGTRAYEGTTSTTLSDTVSVENGDVLAYFCGLNPASEPTFTLTGSTATTTDGSFVHGTGNRFVTYGEASIGSDNASYSVGFTSSLTGTARGQMAILLKAS